MGKSTTYVGTSISPLMGDTKIGNTAKQVTFSHIMANKNIDLNGKSLADELIKARSGNLPNKYRHAVSWAESTSDPYIYGSVKGYLDGSVDAAYIRTVVENQLEISLGYPISVDYCMYDTTNNYHMFWSTLIRKYGYNPIDNTLSTLSAFIGKPCYLYDGVIKYCSHTVETNTTDVLNPIGLAFNYGQTMTRIRDESRLSTPWVEQSSVNKDTMVSYYTYRVIETKVIVGSTTTTTTDIAVPTSYESLVTTVVSDTTVTGTRTIISNLDYVVSMVDDFLLYEWSGSIPDSLLGSNTIDPNAVYIPNSAPWAEPIKHYYMVMYHHGSDVGYFTYEFGSGGNTTLDDLFNVGGQIGKYTPRLYCRLAGTKLNASSLKTTEAYKDSNKLGKKLGLDWSGLTDQIHTAIGDLQYVRDIYITAAVPVADATDLQLRYLFNWFSNLYDSTSPVDVWHHKYKNGTGLTYAVATYLQDKNVHDEHSFNYSDDVYSGSLYYKALGKVVTTGNIGIVGTIKQSYSDMHTTVFEAVASKTVFIFSKQTSETEVTSLYVYQLNTSQNVGGVWAGSTLSDKNILLPLDITTKSLFTPNELEEFYNSCLYVVVNTSQTVKEKWYESSWFKALTFVIAVVLAIPSGGQSLTIWSIVYAVVEVVLMNILLSFAITVLVDVLGLDVKGVLILVVVVAAVTGNFDGLKNIALTTLKATNAALTMSMEAMKNDYEDLVKEMEVFQSLQDSQNEKLDVARELLHSTGYIFDPIYQTTNTNKYFYTLGDTASEYINRSIHMGNPDSLVFNTVSDYASVMLRLPDIKTTLSRYNLT